MVDGKESMRGPAGPGGTMTQYNCILRFTSNSKHIWFTSSQDGSTNQAVRLVFDGKPGPWSNGLPEVVFSPDGDHFAYILSDRTHTQLFVDGQPAPYAAGAPLQWTATDHLYTQRVSRGQTGPIVDVLVDGKPVMRTNGVQLWMPPVGDMVIAKVTGGQGLPFFVVAGKRVPGSEPPIANGSGDPVFSPDGRHYAIRMSGGNQTYVFSDGSKGLGYFHLDSIGLPVKNDPIAFSPDSSKMVYAAVNNSNNDFIVYGGNESDPLPSILEGAFSPVGGHFLATGFGVVTLDGKILKLPNVSRNASQAGWLGFSPDGTRYAFVVRNGGTFSLYVDGVPQAGYYWAGSSVGVQKGKNAYVFSPDSKHIAYFCRSSNPAAGNDLYLCFDNKGLRLGPGSIGDNLTFTADGNHLVWMMSEPQSGWRVFVDGKPVAEGYGRMSDATWQPGPDPSSWSFLLQDNDGLKRVTVTASSASSLARLFAGSARK